jgi:hypothetical protein
MDLDKSAWRPESVADPSGENRSRKAFIGTHQGKVKPAVCRLIANHGSIGRVAVLDALKCRQARGSNAL